MDSDIKGFAVLAAVVLGFIFGAVGIAGYVSNSQRLQCMELNKHRQAAEVIAICAPIKI